MSKIRSLGVLLCYNDADILEDAILHLLNTGHDLIAWDHGSDDGTAAVLDKYQGQLVERKFIPRSFDFYNLYPHMSEHLMKEYVSRYDWISWPDQDELLEGPDRTKNYQEWVAEIFEQGYDYVQFSNFNFWFTADDDPAIVSPVERVKYYGLFPDCAPRIRAWRASKTNIRVFNHNPVEGRKAPVLFNLRHYPMRTKEQMIRRLNKDRANLQRGGNNYHYENMSLRGDRLMLRSGQLHLDDRVGELNPEVKYNWRDIYGYGVEKPG